MGKRQRQSQRATQFIEIRKEKTRKNETERGSVYVREREKEVGGGVIIEGIRGARQSDR